MRIRVALLLTLITLGLAMTVIAAPAAAGGGTLDQQSTTFNNIEAITSTFNAAQLFTAGRSGQLDQVDLYLGRSDSPFPPPGPGSVLTVEIWTVTGGALASPIPGASATVLEADVPSNTQTWVSVPISAPSVAATQYAIVLRAPTASIADCLDDCWTWLIDQGDPYAGGPSCPTQMAGRTGGARQAGTTASGPTWPLPPRNPHPGGLAGRRGDGTAGHRQPAGRTRLRRPADRRARRPGRGERSRGGGPPVMPDLTVQRVVLVVLAVVAGACSSIVAVHQRGGPAHFRGHHMGGLSAHAGPPAAKKIGDSVHVRMHA